MSQTGGQSGLKIRDLTKAFVCKITFFLAVTLTRSLMMVYSSISSTFSFDFELFLSFNKIYSLLKVRQCEKNAFSSETKAFKIIRKFSPLFPVEIIKIALTFILCVIDTAFSDF